MKHYINILMLLAGFLAMISCDKPSDTYSKTPKIAISIQSEIPATVYPGDKISFDFLLEYQGGIESCYATIDGDTVTETVKEYNDEKPQSTNIRFDYVAQDIYAGNTIDFAVCASSPDGAVGHYDIPVFVMATKPDVVITIPDNAPEKFEVDGSTLSFPITIESGSTDIKSVTTKKGDDVIPEMTFNATGDLRKVTFTFSYTPTLGDTGVPTVFTFEVMDVNGNIVSSAYSVQFFKAASTELNEYSGVTLGMQKCTSAGQFFNVAGNVVYNAAGVSNVCTLVDFAVFWSNNSGTQGAAFASPVAQNVSIVYTLATITALGGTAADVPTAWATRNEATFRELELSADDFAAISTVKELRDYYASGVKPTNDHVTFVLKSAGKVRFFIIRVGGSEKIGALRVTKAPGSAEGSITFDYKIEK